MAGMAILILCAATGADDSGWRTTPNAPAGSGRASAASAVQPATAVSPWPSSETIANGVNAASRGDVNGMVDAASEAIRSRLEQELYAGPNGTPRDGANRSAAAATRTVSGSRYWPEVEGALDLPAPPAEARSPKQGGPGGRMRRGDTLTPAPTPPLAAATRAAASPQAATTPAAARNAERNAGDFPVPSRGNIRQWLEQPPEETAASPEPGPRRDVLYEERLAANETGRRYLAPPAREDSRGTGNSLVPIPQAEPTGWPTAAGGPAINSPSGTPETGPLEFGAASSLPPPPTVTTQRPSTADESLAGVQGPSDGSDDPNDLDRERRWPPLIMAVLGLFGSLGFNFYLGWIAWDLYTRYQDALDDVHELETKLDEKPLEHELARPASRGPSRHAMAAGL